MENIVSTQEKRCYTVKELQEILGISRPTVYELLKKNKSSCLKKPVFMRVSAISISLLITN